MSLGAAPELAAHTAYLSDTRLLELLELGLESTLRALKDQRRESSEDSPCAYLATWLLRHNPKHSERGRALLEAFAATLADRDPLDEIGDIEDQRREAAALRVQSAARGHTARLLAGEHRRESAALRVQASVRGRQLRQHAQQEQREREDAAVRVQASVRAHAQRTAYVEGRREAQAAQDRAATRLQSSVRGRATRQVRSAPTERADAAAEAEAAAAAATAAAQAAAEAAVEVERAATALQAAQRGRMARKPA